MIDVAEDIRALWDELYRVRSIPGVAPFMGARVYNSANLTIGNNSLTALTFDSERFDTDAFHDAGTNPGRLTIPADGYYLVGITIIWTTAAGGRRLLRLRAGGTTNIAEVEIGSVADATAQPGQTVCTVAQFAAAGYVEALAFQVSGGPLDILASSAMSPEFWIVKVG